MAPESAAVPALGQGGVAELLARIFFVLCCACAAATANDRLDVAALERALHAVVATRGNVEPGAWNLQECMSMGSGHQFR